jgi:chromate transport protein ChrA
MAMQHLEIFEYYKMFAVLWTQLFAPATVLIIISMAFCKQTVHRSIWFSIVAMLFGALLTYAVNPEHVLSVIAFLLIGGAAAAVFMYKGQKYGLDIAVEDR